MKEVKRIIHEEGERRARALKEGRAIVASRAEQEGHPLKACVVTFGCQMNARDSEKLRGVLDEMGFLTTEEEADA
ncbi:MAG: tRNA (N6-isopentenyl adenosine(37)-C2)-methylthiotransferase MiaB, partial [Lachnospiraceae bacterium]|nr:tRNA (N6-isopentenyl adenosine(37)-C2)-methylthiotransferase MiaB [Lachnospiraceae bacterium]